MADLVLPQIDAYAAAHSLPETPVRKALSEETERTMEFARMLVGPLEGAFLHMMTRLVQARGCWKSGCLRDTARSVLPKHCPTKDAWSRVRWMKSLRPLLGAYFAQSPHGRKIEIRMGPALETMAGLKGPFDLIFIDADKLNYLNYYRRALELLSPRGVILIDNVLWDGEVLRDPPPDDRTAAIQELNRVVTAEIFA